MTQCVLPCTVLSVILTEITKKALFERSCEMACGWLASPAQPPVSDSLALKLYPGKAVWKSLIKIHVFCMFTALPAEFLLQKQPAPWFMSLQMRKRWSRRDLVHVGGSSGMLVHMRLFSNTVMTTILQSSHSDSFSPCEVFLNAFRC